MHLQFLTTTAILVGSGFAVFTITVMNDFDDQVVGDSPLVETLTEMYALYHHTFLSTLELHVCRLLEKTQPPNQDLSPSNGVNLLLNLLRDVLSGGHITDAQANDMTNVNLMESIVSESLTI